MFSERTGIRKALRAVSGALLAGLDFLLAISLVKFLGYR
jgi:hypothetical protein